jgi:hypothetical protein
MLQFLGDIMQNYNHEDALKINFALSYPFFRPDYDFVLHKGREIILDAPALQMSIQDILERYVSDVSPDLSRSLRPIIACGSNASPVQLHRKFSNRGLFVCLRRRLNDHVVGYARQIANYGSIPATLEPMQGQCCDVSLLFVDQESADKMDQSEAIGECYNLLEVNKRDFENIPLDVADTITAYQSATGCLSCSDGNILDCSSVNQWDVQKLVKLQIGESVNVFDFILQNINDRDLRDTREKKIQGM